MFKELASKRIFALVSVAGGTLMALLAASPASATIVFSTGNPQYTGINFQATVDALSVTGDIGNTGLQATFENMTLGGSQISMHAQNGAAFIESTHDSAPSVKSTGFDSITMVAQAGYGFSVGNFNLDQLNKSTSPGDVTFIGYDQSGNPVTTSTFAINENGQNTYQWSTSGGELLTKLIISSDTNGLLLQDLKQVSVRVSAVPEASTWAMLILGFCGMGLMAYRNKVRVGFGTA